MTDAGKGIIDLDVDASGVNRKVRDVGREMGRHATSAGRNYGSNFTKSVGSSLSNLTKTVAVAGAAAAGGLAAGFAVAGGFGLKLAGEYEQIEVALGGLLGSGEAATDMLADLRKFAVETPFDLPGLAEASRRLLGVGFAAEDVIPALGTIGDVAATLGVGATEINGVVRALGQMRGKGKASAEELQQISEQLPGFVAIDAVAKGLGITTEEAFKQMERGAIPAEAAIDAILVGMRDFPGAAGAMERQSETLLGMFNRLKESVRLALLDSIQPLIPQLKTLIPGVSAALGQLAGLFGSTFAAILPSLTKVIGPLVDAIAPVAESLGSGLVNVFAGLADGLTAAAPGLEAFGEAFGRLGELIGPIAAVLGELLGEALTQLAPVLDALVTAAAPLIPILGEALLTALESLRPVWPPFIEALKEMQPLITELATELGNELVGVFQELLPVMVDNFPAIMELAKAMTELLIAVLPIVGPLTKLVSIILKFEGIVFIVIAKGISALADAIGAVVRFDYAGAWGRVTDAVVGFANRVRAILPAVVTFFQQLPGKIAQALSTLVTDMVPKGIELLAGFLAGMVQFLPKLLLFIVLLPLVITAAMVKLGQFLIPKALEFLGGFLTGLARKLPEVAEFMVTLPGKLIAKLVDLGSKLIPKAMQFLGGFLTGLIRKIPDVLDWLSELPGRLIDRLGDMGNDLLQVGKDLISGLWNGIKNFDILGKLKGLAGDIVDAIKNPLDIFSPSRVMAKEVGAPIAAGILKGYEDEMGPLPVPTVAGVGAMSRQLAAFTPTVGAAGAGQQVTIENFNAYDRVDTDRFLFDLGFKLATA